MPATLHVGLWSPPRRRLRSIVLTNRQRSFRAGVGWLSRPKWCKRKAGLWHPPYSPQSKPVNAPLGHPAQMKPKEATGLLTGPVPLIVPTQGRDPGSCRWLFERGAQSLRLHSDALHERQSILRSPPDRRATRWSGLPELRQTLVVALPATPFATGIAVASPRLPSTLSPLFLHKLLILFDLCRDLPAAVLVSP
jgi:hypothetical protein